MEKYHNSKTNNLLTKSKSGHLPKIDEVLKACGSHGWNMWRGWVNVLAKQGLLNRVFAPKANWNNTKPLDDDGLWEYLEKPTGDIMLLAGFDWHSQPLHRSLEWQERWRQAKVEKIALLQENYSAKVTQNNLQWQQQMSEAISTASLCIDRLICHHEPDVQFLKENYQIDLPSLFLCFAIDPQYFRPIKPFENKINRAAFRGNISAYFSGETYQDRRKLIELLRESGQVDIFEYTYNNADKNEFLTTEGVKKYADLLNQYRIQLNLPSISQTLTNRPMEVMACGGVLLQNSIIGEESKTFFEDQKHLIFYDENNPQDLLNKIIELQKNPDLAYQMAKEGQKNCYENHTLFERVISILNWLNYDIKKLLKPKLIFIN
ncbi:glycosyltransferase [Geminocystis sp. GBBB08]|uniref:glycosyltransferase n=1 Tax=Geminocystis sp. GBBB08 TaxID=2604140 RepID=UPI0027E2A2EF|nr:glycosyltransferase [Geminocystis sp. GBBB08]MBL1210470.1 glycosyltransferase family 1 protein [Geminocystis sp. GBBB08]